MKKSKPQQALTALKGLFVAPKPELPALQPDELIVLHGLGARRLGVSAAPIGEGAWVLSSKRFLWRPGKQMGWGSPGPPINVRLDDIETVSTANFINWVFGGSRLKLYLHDSTLVQLFVSERRAHELDELADRIRTLIAK